MRMRCCDFVFCEFLAMSANAYETDSLNWQVRQGTQRLSEWIEYQTAQWTIDLDIDLPDLPNWAWPEEIGQGIFWLLVVAGSIWLSWCLTRGIAPYFQRWLDAKQDWTTALSQAAPTASTHSPQYWFRQAQVQARQGNYRDACLALYQATIQRLNDSQTLPHDPSRTDGEYLQQLAPGPRFRPYQLLFHTHERLTFSPEAASAETFQRCRRAYEEIQKP